MDIKLKELLIEAIKCIDSPYLWGGDSLEGFDCSGLVHYIYKHIGVDMPRTIQEQILLGDMVPLGRLQEGDLLFFGTDGSNLHHVGMYIGRGVMIEAPRAGQSVRMTNYKVREDLICAKRYIDINSVGEDIICVTTCIENENQTTSIGKSTKKTEAIPFGKGSRRTPWW